MINLGSWIARLGIPVGSLYSSTKGAVETLTRAWAAEFGPAGAETARRAGVLMRGTPANATGTRTRSRMPRSTWHPTRRGSYTGP